MTHAEWLQAMRREGDLESSNQSASEIQGLTHQARLALSALCANFAGDFDRAAGLIQAAAVADMEALARGCKWPLIIATWSADLALLSGQGITDQTAVDLVAVSQAFGHKLLKREAWATLARSMLNQDRVEDAARIFTALRDTEDPHEHERRSAWSAGLALARGDAQELEIALLHAGAVEDPLPRALRYSLASLVAEQLDEGRIADESRDALCKIDIPSIGLIEDRLDRLIATSARCAVC